MNDLVITTPVDDGVILRLNRLEKANALNAELIDALAGAFELAVRTGKQFVVFSGGDRNFSSGFDFTTFRDVSEADLLLRFVRIEQLLQSVRHAPCITAAFIRGAAYGAGADLAAACTLRLGTETAKFRFPGALFGVVLGTRHLASSIGVTKAKELLHLKRSIDAQQALAYGLLTSVVSEEADDVSAVRSVLQDFDVLDRQTENAIDVACTPEARRSEDMGRLVRSLSRPGLHERIERYLNRQ